jgi:hypothetical protein
MERAGVPGKIVMADALGGQFSHALARTSFSE